MGLTLEQIKRFEKEFEEVMEDAKTSEACLLMTTGRCMVIGEEKLLLGMIATAIEQIADNTPDKERFNYTMKRIIEVICTEEEEKENDKINLQGPSLS